MQDGRDRDVCSRVASHWAGVDVVPAKQSLFVRTGSEEAVIHAHYAGPTAIDAINARRGLKSYRGERPFAFSGAGWDKNYGLLRSWI